MTADLAFHWAPTARRRGIERRGLVPGARSRNGVWRPPFVCLSREPAYALASSDAQTPVGEPMDLWQVDLTAAALPGYEEFDFHDEIRVYVPIPKRAIVLLATRDYDPQEDR